MKKAVIIISIIMFFVRVNAQVAGVKQPEKNINKIEKKIKKINKLENKIVPTFQNSYVLDDISSGRTVCYISKRDRRIQTKIIGLKKEFEQSK